MRKIVVILFIGMVLSLSGCSGEVKQEFSTTLHEDALVVDAVYTPSRHDTNLGFTAIKAGPMGIDLSGNMGFSIGSGLQISSVEVPEKYAVVFKCQHGQFIITRKDTYMKFKDHVGKTVDVAYREVYRTTYEMKEGKKIAVDRVLIDYNFLDATLR